MLGRWEGNFLNVGVVCENMLGTLPSPLQLTQKVRFQIHCDESAMVPEMLCVQVSMRDTVCLTNREPIGEPPHVRSTLPHFLICGPSTARCHLLC